MSAAQACDPATVTSTRASARVGDFNFLVGTWSVRHRRLREPLTGRSDWYEFTGSATAQTLFGGAVSIDEITLADGASGLSLRLRNPATQEWTIYWVNSRDGRLQAPVVGRWSHNAFTGHGRDSLAGRPITARYRWSAISAGSARWEQAFSADGGRTWETNWVMDWTRGGRAESA